MFADLAAAVAGRADCIDGVGQRCGDREHVFGAAASTTTMWRLVDQRIDAAHLPGRPRRPAGGCTSTSLLVFLDRPEIAGGEALSGLKADKGAIIMVAQICFEVRGVTRCGSI